MDKLLQKINQEQKSNLPIAFIIQEGSQVLKNGSEIYNEDAKAGMFWVSSDHKDIFLSELSFIFVDFKSMWQDSKDKNKKYDSNELNVFYDNAEKKFCYKDDVGVNIPVWGIYYLKVLIKHDNEFIPAVIKLTSSSINSFKHFADYLNTQYAKEKANNSALDNKQMLFRLTTAFKENSFNSAYVAVFSHDYEKIDAKLLAKVEENIHFLENTNDTKQEQLEY